MKSVDFSIIIPTFNRCDILQKAIESVILQKSDNWELIIIDDGSTDNTKEIISKYQNLKNFNYFFQDNRGVSSARNKGVGLSKGTYLIFLDSDDQFSPDLIQTLEEEEFWKFDFLCWQVKKIIDGKQFIWRPRKLNSMYNGISASFLAGSCCYSKKVFLEAEGFDPKISFGENYELGLRISEIKSLRIKIINSPLLNYCIQTTTRTSNSINNRVSSYIHLYKKHKLKYLKHPKENSKINYLLAHVLEKSGRKSLALQFYRNSFRLKPWNIKAAIKSLSLNSK